LLSNASTRDSDGVQAIEPSAHAAANIQMWVLSSVEPSGHAAANIQMWVMSSGDPCVLNLYITIL